MMSNNNVILIDGSMGEGGGQILRTALSLSAILRKPVKIVNIRAKRRNPGLQAQHLTSVKALAKLSNARVEGAYKGSTELLFIPKDIEGGTYSFNIGTAGSITLVMQATVPVMAFAKNRTCIRIVGGTDVSWSPPIDYMRFVYKEILRRIGINLEIKLFRRGHYPRGGGIVEYCVDPLSSYIRSVNMVERGRILSIRGLSHAVKLPKHVAERQAKAAREYIINSGCTSPEIDIEWYEPSRDKHLGPGSGIVLWAICENSILGGDSLGAKGKPAEKVGYEAALKLVEDLKTGMAFDRHMSDMIIPLLVLAKGKSVIGGSILTLHAYTNIMVVSRIIDANVIHVDGELNKPFKAEIEGLGLRPA